MDSNAKSVNECLVEMTTQSGPGQLWLLSAHHVQAAEWSLLCSEISLKPFQTSGSSDDQFLALLGNLGLADYQFSVPIACFGVSSIYFLLTALDCLLDSFLPCLTSVSIRLTTRLSAPLPNSDALVGGA